MKKKSFTGVIEKEGGQMKWFRRIVIKDTRRLNSLKLIEGILNYLINADIITEDVAEQIVKEARLK